MGEKDWAMVPVLCDQNGLWITSPPRWSFDGFPETVQQKQSPGVVCKLLHVQTFIVLRVYKFYQISRAVIQKVEDNSLLIDYSFMLLKKEASPSVTLLDFTWEQLNIQILQKPFQTKFISNTML